MRVYFIDSQVPELRPLPPTLRRLVVRRALALLRLHGRVFCWLPNLLCVVGGVVGWLLGAALLAYIHQAPASINGDSIFQSFVWSYSGVAVGAFSAGFIGLQLQRLKLRPYLRSVIKECGYETTAAT